MRGAVTPATILLWQMKGGSWDIERHALNQATGTSVAPSPPETFALEAAERSLLSIVLDELDDFTTRKPADPAVAHV
jgi:hypothetical protein